MNKEKRIKFLKKTARWLVLAVLVLVGGLVAASTLNVPGGYKFLVVQSGSMEPAIKRMGIVVVKPLGDYKKGEVITVVDSSNPDVSLTHRIFKIEEEGEKTYFITKGDANEEPDIERVAEDRILGKVIFTVPYLGYPISFAKTRTGLILLVIMPATIIIYSELLKIRAEIGEFLKKRKLNKVDKK